MVRINHFLARASRACCLYFLIFFSIWGQDQACACFHGHIQHNRPCIVAGCLCSRLTCKIMSDLRAGLHFIDLYIHLPLWTPVVIHSAVHHTKGTLDTCFLTYISKFRQQGNPLTLSSRTAVPLKHSDSGKPHPRSQAGLEHDQR